MIRDKSSGENTSLAEEPHEDALFDSHGSYVGIEQITGIPLVWKQRSFYNYVLSGADFATLSPRGENSINSVDL